MSASLLFDHPSPLAPPSSRWFRFLSLFLPAVACRTRRFFHLHLCLIVFFELLRVSEFLLSCVALRYSPPPSHHFSLSLRVASQSSMYSIALLVSLFLPGSRSKFVSAPLLLPSFSFPTFRYHYMSDAWCRGCKAHSECVGVSASCVSSLTPIAIRSLLLLSSPLTASWVFVQAVHPQTTDHIFTKSHQRRYARRARGRGEQSRVSLPLSRGYNAAASHSKRRRPTFCFRFRTSASCQRIQRRQKELRYGTRLFRK